MTMNLSFAADSFHGREGHSTRGNEKSRELEIVKMVKKLVGVEGIFTKE